MNKYVFITGATSGFGEACSRIFAENGWNLIITGRREDRLVKLAADLIREFSVKIEVLNFDVKNLDEVNNSVESLSNEVKNNIEILINNAGLAVGSLDTQDR